MCSCISNAQGGFKKKYFLQNSSYSSCRNVIEAPGYNLVMIGLTVEPLGSGSFNRLSIVGADALGNQLWRKNYGSPGFLYLDNLLSPRGAVYKDASGFYHTLVVQDSSHTHYIGALIKFDYNGNLLWQKTYKDSFDDLIPQGITKSIDNGFLITGSCQGPNSNSCLLIKTDLNGNELWRKKITKTVPSVMDGKSIVQDSVSKKIVIVGYQYIGSSTQQDTYSNVLILDSLGGTLLHKTFNNAGGGGFMNVIQLKDKSFLTCGGWLAQQTPGVGRYSGLVVKFDTNGTIIWTKKYLSVTSWSGIIFLNEQENEDIMMLGVSDPSENNLDDNTYKLQLLRIDKNGLLKFKKFIGNSDGANEKTSEFANSFNRTSDNGYVIASWFQFLNTTHPFSIIKIDSTGCDTVDHWCVSVALAVNKFTELTGFNLELFPNPANDFINIKIDAPLDKQFTAKLTDVTGKEVDLLDLESGSNAQVNTAQYAPGLYFVNVFYEGRAVETKRLVISR